MGLRGWPPTAASPSLPEFLISLRKRIEPDSLSIVQERSRFLLGRLIVDANGVDHRLRLELEALQRIAIFAADARSRRERNAEEVPERVELPHVRCILDAQATPHIDQLLSLIVRELELARMLEEVADRLSVAQLEGVHPAAAATGHNLLRVRSPGCDGAHREEGSEAK